MEKRDTFNLYIQDAIRDNWDRLSLSDFDGIQLQYRDVARKIEKLHILFDKAGIKPGDKIALCGKNSAHWSIVILSVITYGAVAVPILHEFSPESIQNLTRHSEAKLLFCDKSVREQIHEGEMPDVLAIIDIYNYSLLFSRSKPIKEARVRLNMLFGDKFPERFVPADVVYYQAAPEDIAVINYTSGTSGVPKGVMISHRALWSNLQFCIDGLTFLKPGDGVVCMLPLAHMFGLMVDLFHCFVKGCHINFITRLPSPKVILSALAEVKPKLVVSVPLVIEKIIRKKVFPKIQSTSMRIALVTPGLKNVIFNKIRQNIINAFGGNLKQLIIGGASLSREVESFLRKIHFPFTVGYGMTECAPLIAYAPWEVQRPQSCGKLVPRMEAKIDSSDPSSVPGVLWVKGQNVMSGYYKNPDDTKAVFDADGWMCTGDVCTKDADGFLYIHGRQKTMILGASGQNIYPEEIEHVLGNLPYVGECLVISEDGKLVALVYPEHDNEEMATLKDDELKKVMDENLKTLNAKLQAYSKVAELRIRDKEFEKTPKRSIKRFLYQADNQ